MNYDLNLLNLFDILMKERNLTRTAHRLRLTQPAISRALNRLRADFGDQLFVRTASGVIPTPKALALELPVKSLMRQIDELYAHSVEFDIGKAHETVRIATTDYFEQVVGLNLFAEIATLAPNLKVATLMTGSQIPMQDMRDGQVQLAIAGFFDELPAGFMRQEILTDEFLCCVRKGNPFTKNGLDLKTYLQMGHVIVSSRGVLEGAVDSELKKKNKKRKVVVGVVSFNSCGRLIERTDHVLTLPARIVKLFEKDLQVQTFAPPIALPKIRVVQVWHERYQQDPLHTWIRELVARQAKETS